MKDANAMKNAIAMTDIEIPSTKNGVLVLETGFHNVLAETIVGGSHAVRQSIHTCL